MSSPITRPRLHLSVLMWLTCAYGFGQNATSVPVGATTQTAEPKTASAADTTLACSTGKAGLSAPSTNACRTVELGPDGDDAPTIQKQLSTAGGVSAIAVGSRMLVLCGPPATVDILGAAIYGSTGAPHASQVHETHLVRLFYARQAAEIAAAINNTGGLTTPVKAVGEDLLIFPAESDSDNAAAN